MKISLDPLDLAALLSSRICHDVISPVGAIINGLEILEDEKDPETRTIAVDLIKKSAGMASAKLQFCRLAFGAAGSAGASIDTGDAEKVTRGLLTDDKIKLAWEAPRILMPKNHVKLILNMCLIAIASIPRGGVLRVSTGADGDRMLAKVEAEGTHIRIAHGVTTLLQGETEAGVVDAHAIQPYFTHLVAQSAGVDIVLNQLSDRVVIEALRPGQADETEADDGGTSDRHDAEETSSPLPN